MDLTHNKPLHPKNPIFIYIYIYIDDIKIAFHVNKEVEGSLPVPSHSVTHIRAGDAILGVGEVQIGVVYISSGYSPGLRAVEYRVWYVGVLQTHT